MARTKAWFRVALLVVGVSACISKGDTNITTEPIPEGGAGGSSGGAGSIGAGAGGTTSGTSGSAGTTSSAGTSGSAGAASGAAGGKGGTTGKGGTGGTGGGEVGGGGQSGSGATNGGSAGAPAGSCAFQEASQLTVNASSKRGLSVSTDGTAHFVTWLGQPGGADKWQYFMSDGSGAPGVPITGDAVKPGGPNGAYIESIYSAKTQRFVALWMDHADSYAYPQVRRVKADGTQDDTATASGLGSFISNDAAGRHRLALANDTFLLSYYFCPMGGGDCSNLPANPTFHGQPYMFMGEQTLAGSSPGLVYGEVPKFEGQRIGQTVAFNDSESQTSGFLLFSDGSSGPRLTRVVLGEKPQGPVGFEPAGNGSNINAETRIAWDGEALVAFSYGAGSGLTGGQALRQERFTLLGKRTLEAKIDIKPVRTVSIHVADSVVSLLATDGSALYFLQRTQSGEEILAPQVVGSGTELTGAYLLRDAGGFVAFWMAKVSNIEQVFSTRIVCTP